VDDVIRAFARWWHSDKGEARPTSTVAKSVAQNIDAIKTALKSVTGKDVAPQREFGDPAIIAASWSRSAAAWWIVRSHQTQFDKHAIERAG